MARRLSDQFLDELRARNDIVQVISQYAPLAQKGKRYWACCPFHHEKTPSFSVNPDLQMYYCFGCKKSGNVIRFLMEAEHMDFMEAVERLAERAHMPLPDMLDEAEYVRERNKKERLYELLRISARYYYDALYAPGGEKALAYLKRRGLSDSTIRTFGLGYAPDAFDSITGLLARQGYSEEEMRAAGMAGGRDGKFYDTFRDRVMFPIMNLQGRVVGFGGRTMEAGVQPKYLNSSETAVFSKRFHLYGLSRLRKLSPLENIIVVEGYMDTVSLYQHGVRNAVASLGTALASEQAKLLKRFQKPVYLCYDGDSAGQMATIRGYDALKKEGLDARILSMPGRMDPDEYVRAEGEAAFLGLMKRSVGLAEYQMGLEKEKGDLSTQEGRTAYAMKACRIIAAMESPVEQEVLKRRLHLESGFPMEALAAQITKDTRGARVAQVEKNSALKRRYTKEQEAVDNAVLRAERGILAVLAQEADALLASRVHREDFSLPLHQRLFAALQGEAGPRVGAVAAMLDGASQEEARQIAEIFASEVDSERREVFVDNCLSTIRRARTQERIAELQRQSREVDDPRESMRLMRELQELIASLKG